MNEVTLIPVDPTPDEVQYLEDRIYEFNSRCQAARRQFEGAYAPGPRRLVRAVNSPCESP